MKKLFSSVGILAIGAAGLNAAYAPSLTPIERQKPWSISASLRGFYDDNYNTAPSHPPVGIPKKDGSFGVEVSPTVSVNLPLDQTFVGLSYVYSMRYYEGRPDNEIDHSHQVNAKLDHAFTERYKIELSDSFVIAQEPEILETSPIVSFPLRSNQDNLRNHASALFTAQLTQLLGLQIGYDNTFFDYEQTGVGSLSALLDRMEHLASANLRWQVLPQTVGVLGYQYGVTEYTSNDPLGLLFGFIPFGRPSDRDNRSHYVFVGVDQNFNAKLNASVRVGAQYVDYINVGDISVSPYADANLTYAYAPGSYIQSGIRHARNATDVVGNVFNPTLDQESTAVYAAINHRFTGKLTGSLLGQYQHSTFEGGSVGDEAENFFIAGVNLAYEINKHLLAETGYNYDRLLSDVSARGFSRNRVYIGLRATY